MTKKMLLSGLALMSTVTLAACSAAPTSNASAEKGTEVGKTVKVGLNLELTGGVSAYGSAEEKGAKLAVEEINKKGGVSGKKLEVVSKDNKSDNSEAATVTTSLATESNVNVIVGPATSGATAAASPNASKAAVPLITPSGTQDNLTLTSDGKTNPYVYRTTFIDSYQGDVLAKYATDHLKAKKVVLFYDNSSDYAKGIAKRFKKVYKDTIVSEATFQSGDTDFQSALTKMKSKEYDAIIMPGYYQETGTIIKQAREMGITAPIVGPDGFADSKLVELAGSSNVNNVYYISGFSASSSDKAKQFSQAYKAKYGAEPSMFAALAYDSVYMAADAAKDAKTSVDLSKNLSKLKDFEGVTGTMTIDKKHNPVKSVSVVGLTEGKESSATTVKAD
ncbi:branched-chain amino acid ABC transporter substrate-binding protein [Streptococcus iniae]|uniref:Branched-chain amino acid ABC transporter substrate-binding protein n=1 Tax=Streptococcus iniae TaxID=1346 RepID=A0A1J0N091_STRIN|nr:ABC transporter substrate-binding protein [Streptococcus iniae]AGM99303.1 branched-chain amino acid ABC transporter substrate-binding protein [Streptococcus iniae SF1]AHY16238.1 branched-chain amino acid ABC transporter substrate-binding protein [Streptococcus iniae]AHY18102.1 branched-chain amino acid ABC transporter substrate-binding protein [Streptococcus iniae]AJG26390.1 branched-chain amino acid ABC transporter substrate-binding protein [Streptococcus iniae]APD32268.1 branched-chain am